MGVHAENKDVNERLCKTVPGRGKGFGLVALSVRERAGGGGRGGRARHGYGKNGLRLLFILFIWPTRWAWKR